MKYYLGVDQGGTKSCAAVCAEDGRLLGCGTGGPSLFYRTDTANESMRRVLLLAERILTDAGLSMGDISAVCAGLTCADWDFEYPIHEQRVRQGLGLSEVTVLNDSIIAMRAGSNAPNRAVVCAGTGLNVAVRAAGGEEFIFGYYIAECAHGASALGKLVLEAAADAEVGAGPRTSLTELVLDGMGYASFEALYIDYTMRKLDYDPRGYVVGLLREAHKGDAVAAGIVSNFAAQVARYVKAGLLRLGLGDTDTELVYSGSVFKNVGNILIEQITHALVVDFPRLRYIDARYEPVCGALLTLLDAHYGGRIPEDVLVNFDAGCIRHCLLRNP